MREESSFARLLKALLRGEQKARQPLVVLYAARGSCCNTWDLRSLLAEPQPSDLDNACRCFHSGRRRNWPRRDASQLGGERNSSAAGRKHGDWRGAFVMAGGFRCTAHGCFGRLGVDIWRESDPGGAKDFPRKAKTALQLYLSAASLPRLGSSSWSGLQQVWSRSPGSSPSPHFSLQLCCSSWRTARNGSTPACRQHT